MPEDFTWQPDDSQYFRYIPMKRDWVLLVLMSMLVGINNILGNKDEADKMQNECWEGIRDRYKTLMFILIKVSNIVDSFMIYIVLGILMFFIGKAQSTLIATLFFILNTVTLAFVARSDGKKETRDKIIRLTNIIKAYAAVIILMDMFVIIFLSEQEAT